MSKQGIDGGKRVSKWWIRKGGVCVFVTSASEEGSRGLQNKDEKERATNE